MSLLRSISIRKALRRPLVYALIIGGVLVVIGITAYAFFAYRPSARWARFADLSKDPQALASHSMQPGQRCDEAPFAFPTTGLALGLWNQSYRLGHHHEGIDIFSGAQPGVTPVYAAFPGYLSRLPDWKSSLIIRIPSDPLNPGRQIWTYYTHLADQDGQGFISDKFPAGTSEQYVQAGTFLGYMGDYSGDPGNPVGVHLHFSVVKDDGAATFSTSWIFAIRMIPVPISTWP